MTERCWRNVKHGKRTYRLAAPVYERLVAGLGGPRVTEGLSKKAAGQFLVVDAGCAEELIEGAPVILGQPESYED